MRSNSDLSVIQHCYDLIVWFVPLLERLPRGHKFTLGDRLQHGLYDLLEALVQARFAPSDVAALQRANARLEVLRYQARLLVEFDLIDARRYEHAARLMNDVGTELGGWLRHRRGKGHEAARRAMAPGGLLGEPAPGVGPGAAGEAV